MLVSWRFLKHLYHLPFNCTIYQQVDLAPAVGADLEVMNRDAKKRLVIVVGLTPKKQREHPKQFMILLEPPIIIVSNYSNTTWLGIWSLEPPINQPINDIMNRSFKSFIESHFSMSYPNMEALKWDDFLFWSASFSSGYFWFQHLQLSKFPADLRMVKPLWTSWNHSHRWGKWTNLGGSPHSKSAFSLPASYLKLRKRYPKSSEKKNVEKSLQEGVKEIWQFHRKSLVKTPGGFGERWHSPRFEFSAACAIGGFGTENPPCGILRV